MEYVELSGKIVDLFNQTIQPGVIEIENERIRRVRHTPNVPDLYITPGFIDAHVHIESSMLVPSEFARLAVVHGTVATVSDPHEIANVLGIEGVRFMIENSKKVNFKCFFGAPSCVPATPFETAGAVIEARDMEALINDPDIHYLAEMMNWPGVLHEDPEVMAKIQLAHGAGKPVDGHAPGLMGDRAAAYIRAGITTDHECFTREEALDKLTHGMKVIIREGSAAKNFDALIGLLPEYRDQVMFCSDDKHPDNLVEGHINQLLQRGVSAGIDPLVLLQAACKNPVDHYGLNVGLLRPGDPADLVVLKDLQAFEALQTYINGYLVASQGKSHIESVAVGALNKFETSLKSSEEFKVQASGEEIKVMIAEDGQLITKAQIHKAKIEDGQAVSDIQRDLLKITVVNRYQQAKPAMGFVRNFGLKKGAIASSVAHDSHNIIAVGVDDTALCRAVNAVINCGGGVAAVTDDQEMVLPLPVAGLMSTNDGYEVANAYTEIDRFAKSLGSDLEAPFMTLSFMALLVIPELKLSDKGLFDGLKFQFTELFPDS
ncbi:MAG: adenine deaminase [Cyclobacteriaceae bacterium]|nr:adenine deaminase [Cyclobacteriaceae bacterium]